MENNSPEQDTAAAGLAPIYSNNSVPDSYQNLGASAVNHGTVSTANASFAEAAYSDRPVPVVKVLSVRGVEYLFMSIFLWLTAGSFVGLILSLINGQTGFSSLAFPLSVLVVSLPGLAVLFLRLKAAELADPALRLEASKRRLTQITQLLAFLTCLINVITFVYLVLQKIGGEGKLEVVKAILNMMVILVVAGGILVYYWYDEHKRRG